jgi:transcriptional regulator with XRE-family HTH domain
MAKRRFVARTGADLGRSVAEIRHARGLTQEQLSASTGIERTRLARLESGSRSTIAFDHLMRALRRLGATVTVSFDDHDGQD